MSRRAHSFAPLDTLLRGMVPLLLMVPIAVKAQVLAPQITTNKGCEETGDSPVFAVGEQIAVSFSIGSSSLSKASAAIIDHTSDGQIVVLTFGQVPTNQTVRFNARVGGPDGNETLVLRATAQGTSVQSDPCTFTIAGSPPATVSPHPTRTPTATRTPSTATRTPTGHANLTGELHTNRGCREDGDTATFAVGETILLSFRLSSDASSTAVASILTSRPDGVSTLISFGAVPTDLPLSIGGRVGSPAGVHTLQLRGSVGGPQTTLDTCSFLVAGGTVPTSTPRPTRTTTPTRTQTPTRTFTPVPVPASAPARSPEWSR